MSDVDITVGAGSGVASDLPAHVVAVGSPVRVVRTLDEPAPEAGR